MVWVGGGYVYDYLDYFVNHREALVNRIFLQAFSLNVYINFSDLGSVFLYACLIVHE